MGERVITDACLLEIIIETLDNKRQVMTPSEIYKRAFRKHLLPHNGEMTERILSLLRDEHRRCTGVYFLSSKGTRRFGLQSWRESPEKAILVEIVKELSSFKTQDFMEIVEQKLGIKYRNKTSRYLTELIEDGVLRRAAIGRYDVRFI